PKASRQFRAPEDSSRPARRPPAPSRDDGISSTKHWWPLPPSGREQEGETRFRTARQLRISRTRSRTRDMRSRRRRRWAPRSPGCNGARVRACAGLTPARNAVASPLPVFPDQFRSPRAVRALAGANGCRPRGNLRPAHSGAFRQHPPRFLLARYAAKASLQPEPLGYLVIEVADDDGRHGDDIIPR